MRLPQPSHRHKQHVFYHGYHHPQGQGIHDAEARTGEAQYQLISKVFLKQGAMRPSCDIANTFLHMNVQKVLKKLMKTNKTQTQNLIRDICWSTKAQVKKSKAFCSTTHQLFFFVEDLSFKSDKCCVWK